MPNPFDWKDEYSVGVREIDQQHRKWLAMASELHAALHEGKGREVIIRVLDGVVSYAATHFSYEESEMRRCGYQDYEKHKKMHDAFTAEILELQRNVQDNRYSVTLEVMSKMREWLVNHITKVDKQYSPFIAQKKAA